MSLEKVLDYCRLCQSQEGTLEISSIKGLETKIYECTRIRVGNFPVAFLFVTYLLFVKIQVDDNNAERLPKSICKECNDKVNSIFDYMIKVKQVDAVLRAVLLENRSETNEVSTNSESDKVQPKQYKCSVCKQTYSNYSMFEQHKRSHSTKSNVLRKLYKCRECKQTFSHHRTLEKHKRCHHSIKVPPKQYGCSECEQTYSDYGIFLLHKRSHFTQYCFSCGFIFKDNSERIEHDCDDVIIADGGSAGASQDSGGGSNENVDAECKFGLASVILDKNESNEQVFTEVTITEDKSAVVVKNEDQNIDSEVL